jgi:hypothetical protein
VIHKEYKIFKKLQSKLKGEKEEQIKVKKSLEESH